MDVTPSTPFAALLRHYRLRAGISQEELAERSRLSVRAIGTLERGVRLKPYRQTVQLIAEALNLAPEERAALVSSVSRRRGPPVLPAPAGALPANLPTPATPLIGRADELARLVDRLLCDDVRLLTLTGPPGVGKTTLAQHFTVALAPSFADGVAWVELDAVADPAHVPAAVARTLGIREQAGDPLATTLGRVLAGRRMLLVLDNFEHLLDAAPFAGELLAACPRLKLLVTSRAPLHLRWEQQAPVEPLPVPALRVEQPPVPVVDETALDAIAASPAVELFLARAHAVRPALALTPDTAGAVATICTLLDGLPLAIELAAARVNVFSVHEIAERLSDRLGLLTGGHRDLPARHRTLRAAIDWSHDLLSADEQRAFRLLGVFADGGTLDALETTAQGILGSEHGAALPIANGHIVTDGAPSLIDSLAGLADHSLVRRIDGPDGLSRFRMLESIRAYAVERLEAAGEAQAARLQHAAWCLSLAELAAPRLTGAQQARWLDRLDAEHDNLRAALQWTLDQGRAPLGLQLAVALWRFWQARGHLSEGRAWLDRLLARASAAPGSVRAAALFGAATITHDQGDYTGAVQYAEQSLALTGEMDERSTVDALLLLGMLAYRRSDYAAAAAHGEESLALVRTLGDQRLTGRCHHLLGLVALDEGRYTVAMERFGDALASARAAGDVRLSAMLLNNLGLTADRMQDFAGARAYLEESLALNRRLGNSVELARNLITLALVARAVDDAETAERFATEALILARAMGNRNGITEALNQLTPIARKRGDLEAAGAWSAMHLRAAQEMGYPMQMLAAVTEAAATARASGRPRRATRLFAATEAGRLALGLGQQTRMRRMIEEHLQALHGQLDEPSFAAAWAAGTAMSLHEAITDALAGTDAEPDIPMTQSPAAPSVPAMPDHAATAVRNPPGAPYPNGLTERQVDVLRLLAAGLSNREIAERLVVSERTIEHHIANLYHKIGAGSRVDATAYAYRHQLAEA